MKNIVWRSIVIIALLLSSRVYAYFYYVSVMKMTDQCTGKAQNIILLGDYHDKKHPANKEQRAYLEALLKKCAAVKGKFIVEDLSSINNDGRMICSNFGINCTDGVLGQLAYKARGLGIIVDNIEFRYCRVAGIGPLLHNIQASPFSVRSSATITTTALHKEVVGELEKIKTYNDGTYLNKLYRKTVASVRDLLLKMRFCGSHTCTVAQYCAPLQAKKQYRQELEKLCIFDSALIDMNIVHSIVTCPHIPFIFVVAGGSHSEQVSTMLQHIGYEKVFSSHKHQKPIDITVVDRFIR